MVKYPEDFKTFVRKCVQEFAWHLKIQHYDVELFFEQKQPAGDEGEVKTAASTKVDRKYLKATIYIYPRTLDEWQFKNKVQIGRIVAHEIAHIATQHLFDLTQTQWKTPTETNDAWESLTEIVARLTHRVTTLANKKR